MGRITDASHLVRLLSEGIISGLDKYAQLIAGDANTEYIYSHKATRIAGADTGAPSQAAWYTLWEQEGSPICHGATPAALLNPDNTTQGGLLQTDPGGGRTKFVSSLALQGGVGGAFVIVDKLLQFGGLDGTSIAAQNINGGSSADVTRYTDGVGNLLCAEIYTAVGATQRTITAAYKDGANVAKTTQGVFFGGTNRQVAQSVIPMSLAASGSTVKGVTSVTLSATTGTAGNFGVSIIHPLIIIPAVAGDAFAALTDFLNAPMPPILIDACLAMYWVSADSSAMPCYDAFSTFVEA